jgi:hypothetical protein
MRPDVTSQRPNPSGTHLERPRVVTDRLFASLLEPVGREQPVLADRHLGRQEIQSMPQGVGSDGTDGYVDR